MFAARNAYWPWFAVLSRAEGHRRYPGESSSWPSGKMWVATGTPP